MHSFHGRSRKITALTLFYKHGESQFNVEGKIGGDAPLSERGMKYASALPALITDNIGDAPLTVRYSTFLLSAFPHYQFPQ